jgi:hypothetical protein
MRQSELNEQDLAVMATYGDLSLYSVILRALRNNGSGPRAQMIPVTVSWLPGVVGPSISWKTAFLTMLPNLTTLLNSSSYVAFIGAADIPQTNTLFVALQYVNQASVSMETFRATQIQTPRVNQMPHMSTHYQVVSNATPGANVIALTGQLVLLQP